MTPPPSTALKISNAYFFFALVLLAAAIAYGVFQFRIVAAENKAVVENEARHAAFIETLNETVKRYRTLADERAQKQKDLIQKVRLILPPDENYTEFTRQLDNFFAANDTPKNPIFQESLRFGKGMPVENLPDVAAISVSMNVETTRENFQRFLKFVNESGSLETDERLMDINSISFNFMDGGEVLDDQLQKMNVTLEMNAYYQTSRVAR